MCGTKKCCSGGEVCHWIVKIIVIIGGINWGLIGLGLILDGGTKTWDLVQLIFGAGTLSSSIIYLVVGVAAILAIFCCKSCKCSCEEIPKMDTPVAPQA